MFTPDFNKKFDEIDGLILEKENIRNYDESSAILFSALKLGEEYGELSESILTFLGHQREEKIKDFKKADLGEEIADVLIQTMVLGRRLDIDVKSAVSKKLEKIKNRLQ